MKGKPLTAESKRDVVELYMNGNSTQKAAEIAGVSVGAAFKILKTVGVMRTRRETHIGLKLSPEVRKRISEMNKGRRLSDEAKRKISEANRIHGVGHKKLREDGYVAIYYPEHPDSTLEGYVMEHRLVMEQTIGRRLGKNEVVHHINHVRSDNRIENLKLMTVSEHMSMHMRERHAERRNKKLTLS